MEDSALEPLHQVERRADHRRIVAIENGARHWNARSGESGQDAMLTVNRMGGRQGRSGGLLAQHHSSGAEGDEVGRVGLTAGDAFDQEFTLPVRELVAHKALERRGIEFDGGRLADSDFAADCGIRHQFLPDPHDCFAGRSSDFSGRFL